MSPARFTVPSSWLRRAAPVLLAVLGGCGGGVYVGWDGRYDDPPEVSLTASATAVPPGASIRLVAPADDDYGIARVEFYRVDASGRAVWICDDVRSPYQCDTVVPDSGNGVVRYYARATDDVGQRTDSNWVSITLLR